MASASKINKSDYFGLKLQELRKDKIKGGLADKKKPCDFDPEDLAEGIKVEMEHTSDPKVAREIAMDHLTEDPNYYKKLKTIEKEENKLDYRDFKQKSKEPVNTLDYKKINAIKPQETERTLDYRNLDSNKIQKDAPRMIARPKQKLTGRKSLRWFIKKPQKAQTKKVSGLRRSEDSLSYSEAIELLKKALTRKEKMRRLNAQQKAAKLSGQEFQKPSRQVQVDAKGNIPMMRASTGEISAHHGPEKVAFNEKRFNANKDRFLSKFNGQEQSVLSNFFNRISNHPERHFVPSFDRNGKQVPRLRHIADLVEGAPNSQLQSNGDGTFKLTQQRHDSTGSGATTWHIAQDGSFIDTSKPTRQRLAMSEKKDLIKKEVMDDFVPTFYKGFFDKKLVSKPVTPTQKPVYSQNDHYHILQNGHQVTDEPIHISEINKRYGGVKKLEGQGFILKQASVNKEEMIEKGDVVKMKQWIKNKKKSLASPPAPKPEKPAMDLEANMEANKIKESKQIQDRKQKNRNVMRSYRMNPGSPTQKKEMTPEEAIEILRKSKETPHPDVIDSALKGRDLTPQQRQWASTYRKQYEVEKEKTRKKKSHKTKKSDMPEGDPQKIEEVKKPKAPPEKIWVPIRSDAGQYTSKEIIKKDMAEDWKPVFRKEEMKKGSGINTAAPKRYFGVDPNPGVSIAGEKVRDAKQMKDKNIFPDTQKSFIEQAKGIKRSNIKQLKNAKKPNLPKSEIIKADLKEDWKPKFSNPPANKNIDPIDKADPMDQAQGSINSAFGFKKPEPAPEPTPTPTPDPASSDNLGSSISAGLNKLIGK